MDAFFGAAALVRRGPRPRTRPGADALIRARTRPARDRVRRRGADHRRHGGALHHLPGRAAPRPAPTRPPARCAAGAARCSRVQRTFLGQVVSTRPCSDCQGYGTVIPHPCPTCAGDGRVRTRRIAHRQDPGRGRGRDADPAGRAGRGRPGRRPAGDLYVEIHERPHDVFTRKGDDLHCRVAAADDRGGAGHPADHQDAGQRGERRGQGGHPAGQHDRLRSRGVPHLRGTGRGDLFVHLDVRTPTKLDAEQERMLRNFPDPRRGGHRGGQAGRRFFSRMRDAFNGHA